MASEYLKKKFADVKPDEPVELTKEQKRANWWYYHKVPILICVIVSAIVASVFYDVLSKKEPDYQIAYVADVYLSEEQQEQITELLTALGTDLNGDGQCMLNLVSYVQAENDPASYAVPVQLTADLAAEMSQIFLLRDPAGFQEAYGALADDRGREAENFACYRWNDCPALQEVDLGPDVYIARRIFDDETANAYTELWQRMTEGAVPAEWTE